MKIQCHVPVVLLVSICLSSSATAATLWWDGEVGAANGASDNVSTAGQSWLSGGYWDNGSTSSTVAVWAAGDSVVFGGDTPSQTITAGDLTLGNLTFGQGGQGTGTGDEPAYTLSGGTLTLSNSIVTANTPTIINSGLAGSTGLTTAGTSTLTLGGSNSYAGPTAITGGTLRISPSGYAAYRYYRFTVSANRGDGYNQIGELHFYSDGVWIPATTGSATGGGGGEQYWGNANDNKGTSGDFSKYGVGGLPYSITYDFGSPTGINSYNWSTGNDSTPQRNPRRWVVSGSNDNSTWVTLDDRSGADQAGPSNTFTWSGATGTYAAVTNGPNDGADNAYPITVVGIGNLPIATTVQISGSATLDLNGCNQEVGSLAGGGNVALTVGSLTAGSDNSSTTFGGVMSGNGGLNKTGTGTLTLTGANTYTGSTNISGGGVLALSGDGSLGGGTYAGAIGGQGALSVSISGTQLLSGANTYTGGTVVNSGTLELFGGSNSNNGDIVMGNGANLTFTDTANSRSFTKALTGTAGNVTFNVNGDASTPNGGGAPTRFDWQNTGSFTGTIIINQGIVSPNSDTAFGAADNVIQLNAASGAYAGLVATSAVTLPSTRSIQLVNAGGNGTLRTYGNQTLEINGVISGPGNLYKTDSGTVNLAGSSSNIYSGTTTVGDGTLNLSKTGGAVAVPGNLTMANNSNVTQYQPNQLASASSVAVTATNNNWARLSLNGNSLAIAGITDAGGAVIQNGRYGVSAPANAVLTLNLSSPNNNISAYLRDNDNGSNATTLGVTVNGTGAITLSGGNISHTGATTINSGTLVLRDTTGFRSAISVGAGGTLKLVRTAAGFGSRSAIAASGITGSGVINIDNAANSSGGTDGGWVIANGLSALNFSGTINVNSGVFGTDGNGGAGVFQGSATVNIATGAVFTNHSGSITIGALNGSGDVTPAQSGGGTYSFTVGSGGASGNFSGVIHGNNTSGIDGTMECGYLALYKTGTGTQVLTGDNTFRGTPSIGASVFIYQGVLSTDNIRNGGTPSGLGSNGSIALLGGTLQYTGSGGTTNRRLELGTAGGTINASGSGALVFSEGGGGQGGAGQSGAATLTLTGTSSAENTMGYAINNASGPTSLVKSGSGKWFLTAANTHTGATTVASGTLVVTGSLGASPVTVQNGATLAGNGSLGASLTIEDGGRHALEVAATPEAQATRTVAGTLTLSTGNILDLASSASPAPGTYVLATASGGIIGTPTTVNLAGVSGSVSVDGNNLNLTVGTPYQQWLAQNGLSDTSENLLAFAFGTDPGSSSTAAIEWSGESLTTRGQPTTSITNIENGVDFRAVFGRRKDYLAAGLVYTVQFSAGLNEWVTSTTDPTVLASDEDIEAVSVPYPLFILTSRGAEKPAFFRVAVTVN